MAKLPGAHNHVAVCGDTDPAFGGKECQQGKCRSMRLSTCPTAALMTMQDYLASYLARGLCEDEVRLPTCEVGQ